MASKAPAEMRHARLAELVSWTLALLGGYGMVRFGLMTWRSFGEQPVLDGSVGRLEQWMTEMSFGIGAFHALLCAGVVGLAIASYWKKPWSRPALVAFFYLFALYMVGLGALLVWGPEAGADSPWLTIRWVLLGMLLLMAGMAVMLARKFSSHGMKALYEKND